MLWILSLQNVLRCSLALDETVASSRLKKDWSAFPVIKWQFSFCAHPDKKADRVSQGPKVGLRRTPEWLEKKGLCPWQISLFDFRSLLLFSSGIEPSKKVRVIALISLSLFRETWSQNFGRQGFLSFSSNSILLGTIFLHSLYSFPVPFGNHPILR